MQKDKQDLTAQEIVDIIGKETATTLALRMLHARKEHPDNGGSWDRSMSALLDEVNEVLDAAAENDKAGVDYELLDVAVCSLRMFNEEWDCAYSDAYGALMNRFTRKA